MAIEKYRNPTPRRRLPGPAVVVVGALAAFGAISLVQWLFLSILGIVKLALTVVVFVGIAGWVVSAKANR